MVYRRALPEDEPFIRSLLHDVVCDELGAGAWPPELRSSIVEMQYRARRQGIRSNYPDAQEEILLLDREAVGWTVIDRRPAEVLLVEIAVARQFRGRGLATRRIHELIAEADKACKPLRLSVLGTNPAQRLYARMGFRDTGSDSVRVYMERPWEPGDKPAR